MKENIELQGHIVDYAKTRAVYVEYKKSGFDKEFYEEHAEELLVYRASKEGFDKFEGKRVPKMKELREEYRKLGKEKDERYCEYRKVKGERKEIGPIHRYIF